MKILFDNNVPTYLLGVLSPHEATTAFREGWHQLANGRLLDASETAGFDLLLTLDTGFRHQQNMKGRSICVAVLEPASQSQAAMHAVVGELLEKMTDITAVTILVVSKRSSE